MNIAFLILAALIVPFLLYTHIVLGGENLKKYDRNLPVTYNVPERPEGIDRLNAYLHENFGMPAQAANASSGWASKRERFDAAGLARDFDCEFRSDSFVHDGIKIDGDWTLLDGADPNKRILYLHGGAFTVGSAISHRPLTYNLAKQTGCAVFAPNYRLMPEHLRQVTMLDFR